MASASRLARVLAVPGLLAALLVAGGPGDAAGTRPEQAPVARPGPWRPPASVRAAGDAARVLYAPAGPWRGPSCSPCTDAPGCSGGVRPGTRWLAVVLRRRFPAVRRIDGYCCRDVCADRPSGRMSLHGAGRALDVMIPLAPGGADNVHGDAVANWLVAHAERLGIQRVIWDGWEWSAARPPGARSRAYEGCNAHRDHVHLELSVDAAERLRIVEDP